MNRIVFNIALVISLSLSSFAENKRPNIILVMADDQGYGDTGYNNHPFVLTPNLDAMAQSAVNFDQFYSSAPVCSPTRASVMTGRASMRTNVVNHGHYLRPQEHTIAEALKGAGYVTGHFGKWHIGSVQPESPTSPGQVGFDESLTALNFFDLDPYLAKNGEIKQFKGQGSTIIMDATIDFIKKHKDGNKPIFAMCWFPAPHDPFKELPVDFEGSEDLYRDNDTHAGPGTHYKELRGYFLEITHLDHEVGKLRKALRDMDIADNTIVWYTSDNGGLNPRSSGGRKSKGSIYEGGLRIPSLLEWPAKLKPKKLKVPASTADIYPTLLKIAKAEVKYQPKLDGISLIPYLKGKNPRHPGIGFWHGYQHGQATWSDRTLKEIMEAKAAGKKNPHEKRILKEVHKFPKRDKSNLKGHAAWNQWPYKIHRIQRGEEVIVELYNLKKDPMETKDLSKIERFRTAKMLKTLETWQRDVLGSLEGDDYKN